MFETFKVKDLKTLISTYRKYHNIKGYSKMKKGQLIVELEKRFIIHEGKLVMKGPEQPLVKKRITPMFVGQLTEQATKPFGSTAHSRATQRALEKADELEKYYTGKNGRDEYPQYGF